MDEMTVIFVLFEVLNGVNSEYVEKERERERERRGGGGCT